MWFGCVDRQLQVLLGIPYLPTFPNSDAGDFFPSPTTASKRPGTELKRDWGEYERSWKSPAARVAASHVYPAENALFPVVHGGRRHFLIPHKPLLFQILQFLLDFDRKSAVLVSRFSKCPDCFSMREISPCMRETRDFSSNAVDSRTMRETWQV